MLEVFGYAPQHERIRQHFPRAIPLTFRSAGQEFREQNQPWNRKVHAEIRMIFYLQKYTIKMASINILDAARGAVSHALKFSGFTRMAIIPFEAVMERFTIRGQCP